MSLKKQNSKTMNKILNPIGWSAYLETITILAFVYYLFIGWKYYRPEIDRFVARLKGDTGEKEVPPVFQYQAEAMAERSAEQSITSPEPNRTDEIAEYEEPNGAVHDLGQSLTACITEASGKPFAPAILIPKLKKLLNDYPDIAASHERDEINALIVRECEKTGTALLSESEVDMWWSA